MEFIKNVYNNDVLKIVKKNGERFTVEVWKDDNGKKFNKLVPYINTKFKNPSNLLKDLPDFHTCSIESFLTKKYKENWHLKKRKKDKENRLVLLKQINIETADIYYNFLVSPTLETKKKWNQVSKSKREDLFYYLNLDINN